MNMITGFNTNVQHDGRTYHVQTEDRGRENPVFESLVYIEGSVVAKKKTHYDEQLRQGATEEMIASLLKRQHQVIIAAIKAGRIEDLIRHYAKEQAIQKEAAAILTQPKPIPPTDPAPRYNSPVTKVLGSLPSVEPKRPHPPQEVKPSPSEPGPATIRGGKTGGLDLDEVISNYLKRSSEQGRLDLEVVAPEIFMAGKVITLRVQVSCAGKLAADAIVTVKVIGTAFKPQVYVGRASREGIASFNLTLPLFTAGTAAIVIEAQSSNGRGELKHLIRRA